MHIKTALQKISVRNFISDFSYDENYLIRTVNGKQIKQGKLALCLLLSIVHSRCMVLSVQWAMPPDV